MEINSTVSQTSNAASTQTSAVNSETNNNMMDKEDFLKLFMESLKHQDPFSPMENAEMMQQLSQLGQMEAVANLKITVDSMKEAMLGTQIQQGSSLLGKEVKAMDSSGQLIEGQADKVLINNGVVELLINNKQIKIGDVLEISQNIVSQTNN